MWPRTTNSKGKLFAVFMLVFFSWVSLSAQETISGKLVRTGTWEGRQVEYLEGEIAVILNPNIGNLPSGAVGAGNVWGAGQLGHWPP